MGGGAKYVILVEIIEVDYYKHERKKDDEMEENIAV